MPRGRYSKKRIYKKKKSVKTETNKQLTRDIKKIKKALVLKKSELKHQESVFAGGSFKFAEWNSGSGDTACAAFTINYPKQGSGVDNRVGDRICVKGLDYRFTLRTDAITQDIDYKIYLLRYNEYTNTTIVPNSQILTFLEQDIISPAPGVGISNRSFRNLEQKQNWTVLKVMKGTMKMSGAMNSPNNYLQNVTKTVRVTYNKPHYLEYLKNGAGDATQLSQGSHVILFVAGNASDVAVAGQLINANDCMVRLTYTDA